MASFNNLAARDWPEKSRVHRNCVFCAFLNPGERAAISFNNRAPNFGQEAVFQPELRILVDF